MYAAAIMTAVCKPDAPRAGLERQMARVFDGIAESYDQWYDTREGQAIFNAELKCIRRLFGHLNGSWLEMGVGTGRFAASLGIATGIDHSLPMLRLCINHSTKIGKLGVRDPCVHFQPGYNALIGPNGSGKSTILRAIALCPMCTVAGADRRKIKYVTTETLNPNIGGSFASWEQMIQGIRTMFLSHGQGVMDSLMNQSRSNETVVLIDSPETGQDMENGEYIFQGLLKMAKTNQVIVATNSLTFMKSGHLLDLGRDSLQLLVKATRNLTAAFDAFP